MKMKIMIIEFEITEVALMGNIEKIVKSYFQTVAIGVRIVEMVKY